LQRSLGIEADTLSVVEQSGDAYSSNEYALPGQQIDQSGNLDTAQTSPDLPSEFPEESPVATQQLPDSRDNIEASISPTASALTELPTMSRRQSDDNEPGNRRTLLQQSSTREIKIDSVGSKETQDVDPEPNLTSQSDNNSETPSSLSAVRIQRLTEHSTMKDEKPILQMRNGSATPVDRPAADRIIPEDHPSAVESEDIAARAEMQQTPPLQEVWQVERIVPARPSPEKSEVIQRNDSAVGGGLQEDISRFLESVASGGPTSSSIEVVAPRRPRPPIQPVSRDFQQPTIMRSSVESPEQQQAGVTTREQTPSNADTLIETPIGPLPADLWTLIDEPVPAQGTGQITPKTRETDSQEQTVPASSSQPVRQVVGGRSAFAGTVSQDRYSLKKGETQSSIPPSPQRVAETANLSPTPQSRSRIQRVAEQYEDDLQTSDVEQRSSSSLEQQQEESTTEESGVDIDDLARKVYAEIKRKLTVEWERLRSRF
jgi:hypothetical protein